MYHAHLSTLFEKPADFFAMEGGLQGFYYDKTSIQNDAINVSNDGFQKRKAMAKKSQEMILIGRAPIPLLCEQDRLFSSTQNEMFQLVLKLTTSKACLQCGTNSPNIGDYEVHLLDAILHLGVLTYRGPLPRTLNLPIIDREIISYSFLAGTSTRNLPSTILEFSPTRVYIFMSKFRCKQVCLGVNNLSLSSRRRCQNRPSQVHVRL